MRYTSGEPLLLGDKVSVDGVDEGLVVCDIDNGRGSNEYPIEDWRHLKTGALVLTNKFGLIMYEQEEDLELELLARAEEGGI